MWMSNICVYIIRCVYIYIYLYTASIIYTYIVYICTYVFV